MDLSNKTIHFAFHIWTQPRNKIPSCISPTAVNARYVPVPKGDVHKKKEVVQVRKGSWVPQKTSHFLCSSTFFLRLFWEVSSIISPTFLFLAWEFFHFNFDFDFFVFFVGGLSKGPNHPTVLDVSVVIFLPSPRIIRTSRCTTWTKQMPSRKGARKSSPRNNRGDFQVGWKLIPDSCCLLHHLCSHKSSGSTILPCGCT